MLKQDMKSVRLAYYVPIQGLLKGVEQSRKDIFEGVQAVMRDPRFTSCWIAETSNSEHDRVSL